MDRTLPHNLEAEKCVLGAILINNHGVQSGRRGHRRAGFLPRRAPAHLREDGRAHRPQRAGRSRHAQGRADALAASSTRSAARPTSASLTDGVPRSANVEYYAKIVKEKSTLRRLIQSANDVLVARLRRRGGRRRPARRGRAIDLPDRRAPAAVRVRHASASWSTRGYQLIEQLQQHAGLVTGVPSGFVDLDEMTSGFQKSDLVIVAARPSMGKTSLVLNMALHCGIEAGKTVGIFSLEMSKEQLFMRMLTSEARVDAHRFRGGFLGEQDYARLVDGVRAAARRQGLHRRHAVGRHPRDARQGAAAQARARPRHARHRLPAADAGPRAVREPAAGAGVDLALAEDSGEGAGHPDPRAQPAEPRARRRAAITGRSSPTCASPARSSRTPTSCCSSSARRCTRPTASASPRPRASPRSSSASSATARPARCALAFLKQYTRFENLARGSRLRPEASDRDPADRRHRRASTAIQANLRAIRALLARESRPRPPRRSTAPGIIAVVKANAYGHGAARGRPRARSGRRVDARVRGHRGRRARCARPASRFRSSCSARSASAISTASSTHG